MSTIDREPRSVDNTTAPDTGANSSGFNELYHGWKIRAVLITALTVATIGGGAVVLGGKKRAGGSSDNTNSVVRAIPTWDTRLDGVKKAKIAAPLDNQALVAQNLDPNDPSLYMNSGIAACVNGNKRALSFIQSLLGSFVTTAEAAPLEIEIKTPQQIIDCIKEIEATKKRSFLTNSEKAREHGFTPIDVNSLTAEDVVMIASIDELRAVTNGQSRLTAELGKRGVKISADTENKLIGSRQRITLKDNNGEAQVFEEKVTDPETAKRLRPSDRTVHGSDEVRAVVRDKATKQIFTVTVKTCDNVGVPEGEEEIKSEKTAAPTQSAKPEETPTMATPAPTQEVITPTTATPAPTNEHTAIPTPTRGAEGTPTPPPTKVPATATAAPTNVHTAISTPTRGAEQTATAVNTVVSNTATPAPTNVHTAISTPTRGAESGNSPTVATTPDSKNPTPVGTPQSVNTPGTQPSPVGTAPIATAVGASN